MDNVWASLIPLVVGSALVPIQIVVTVLLLRASRVAAIAWVAGMTTMRIIQGVLFGLILSTGDTDGSADDGPGPVASSLLLIVALLLLTTAVRTLLAEDDPDAPPPSWLAKVETAGPGSAFAMGAGLMLIGAKFWVFTLGAIAVIGDADLGQPAAALAFAAFVVLAASVHLVLIGLTVAMPARSTSLLDATSQWLNRNNRVIVIAVGLVFGGWFLVKALDGFGVI